MIFPISQRRIIAFSYWASTFCEGASHILIPLYFSSIGIATPKIAVLFVIYEIFGIGTNILSGYFINKVGYKKSFIFALLCHTIASFGYLFIFQGPMFITILIVNMMRSFRGIGKELLKTTSSAYFKTVSRSHLDTHLLLGGKESLKGLGILAGSILLSYLSFKFSFFILGFSTLFFMLIAMFGLHDFKEIKKVSYKGFFKVKNSIVLLSLIRAFLYAGRDIWLVLAVPIYFVHLGVPKIVIGLMLSIGLIIFGLIQPLTGIFVKSKLKIGSVKIKNKWYYEDIISLATFSLLLVPFIGIYANNNISIFFVLYIVYNILAGLATAPHNYLHIRLAKKNRASCDIAFYQTISEFGKLFAVLASGFIYQSYSLIGCLYGSVICLFISGVLGLFLSNQIHREKLQKLRALQ